MPTTILRADGKSMTLDAAVRIRRGANIMVTSHAIEGGAEVSDHAYREPLEIDITGVVTESPYRLPSQPPEFDRVGAAFDFLGGCVGQLVTIVDDRIGTHPSMHITKYPDELRALLGTTFDLGFKQIRIANSVAVTIPPAATPDTGAPTEQDVGEQPTTPTPLDESTAHSLLSGLY